MRVSTFFRKREREHARGNLDAGFPHVPSSPPAPGATEVELRGAPLPVDASWYPGLSLVKKSSIMPSVSTSPTVTESSARPCMCVCSGAYREVACEPCG